MHSNRFQCAIRLTRHAQTRMLERNISEDLLLDLIETGSVKYKNAQHLWIFKGYPERQDNLLCLAAVIGTALVVKTVLNHFSPE